MHSDTTAEAALVHAEALEKLGPGRCFEIAWDLSMAVIDMVRRRLKEQHPDWSDAEIRSGLVWELHGVRIPAR